MTLVSKSFELEVALFARSRVGNLDNYECCGTNHVLGFFLKDLESDGIGVSDGSATIDVLLKSSRGSLSHFSLVLAGGEGVFECSGREDERRRKRKERSYHFIGCKSFRES